MPTRGGIVVLVGLLIACTSNQTTATPTTKSLPQTVSSPSTTDPIGYMRMTSLNVMWASTPKGLFRSTDRGAQWDVVSPKRQQAVGPMFALDDQTAWFVSSPAESRDYAVFHTTDGGLTWSKASGRLAAGHLGQVMFVDKLHGWATVSLGVAAGSEGITILRSSDGGVTWDQIATTSDPTSTAPSQSGLQFACDKLAAVFGTSTIGLLPESCAGGPPAIYRSHDGGVHWTLVGLPSLGQQWSFEEPVFLTATEVMMVGNYFGPSLTLLVSHDAGLSWRVQSLAGSGSVDFESINSGWQLGSSIETTVDGGLTWHPLNVPPPPFRAAEFGLQDLGKGTALAWSFQAAYRTDDGARTWRDITPRNV